MNWTINKCPCGHRTCNKYGVVQLGFDSSSMVDLETAVLLSAAPEMLAALEMVIGTFDTDEPYSDFSLVQIKLVMDAVHKAKNTDVVIRNG